jgi:hypothetical protein
MIERKCTAEELWEKATASYLEWSGSDWPEAEWVSRAKSTLNLYKEYLKLSAGQPDEIKCRAQIGRVLFEGATHLGEIERILQEGVDKLMNSSRAVLELEKAVLLDRQNGGALFSDPKQRELYLPILENLWVLQADYLEQAHGSDEALVHLEKKMTMLDYLEEAYMANACHKLGVLHGIKGHDRQEIVWFQKAIQAAESCRLGSTVYEFYQSLKQDSPKNIGTIKASPLPPPKNGSLSAPTTPHLPMASMEDAARSDGITAALPSQALIEKLFNTAFPDWLALLQSAEKVKQQNLPFATVQWAEREAMYSSRALVVVGEYDIWAMEDGLCLYHHQRIGCLAKILGLFLALLAKLLAPLIRLKRAIEARILALSAGILGPFYSIKAALEVLLLSLAKRLGHWFAFLGIPLAILGFIIETVYMLLSFLRSLLSLLAHPFLLLREILLLPFRMLSALLSRLIKTFLMAWIARLLDAAAQKFLEMMLRRYPWLRGILLGFFRRERPTYPVLIPKRGVSQLLLMKRRGLFGVQEFLVIVEGDALQIGLGAWLAYQIKSLIFPFYWERTIHMLILTKREREKVIQNICSVLDKSVTPWK